MLANEKQFDENLKRIGELYEKGKDNLNCLPRHLFSEDERADHSQLFDILREMRDIAAINLKANHKVTDN